MFFLQHPCLQPPSLFGFSGSLGQPIHLLKIVSANWRVAEGLSKKLPKKMPKNYQNLDILVTWKQFTKFSGWGFSLALIIHLQQIYWECGRRGGGSSLVREPVPQYECSVTTFLKLMIKIEHIKLIQITCLDIWSMLLSGQVPHRTITDRLFP